MMPYLLIAVILVVAIMPLLQFLPGRRHRLQARLREYAASKGLFVEFRPPPAGLDRNDARPGDLIFYGLRLPPPAPGSPAPGSPAPGNWLRAGQSWRAPGSRAKAPALLDELPDDVVAVHADSASCGVYWRESGEEQQVECIHRILLRWSGELGRAVDRTARAGPGSSNSAGKDS